MSGKDGRTVPRRKRALVIVLSVMFTAAGVLVVGHETSIHNVYDELLLEGPGCVPCLAMPGRGHVNVPVDFEAQEGGVDSIADDRADYSYAGGDLESPLTAELYEPSGLYLTILHGSSWRGDEIDIYADSGFLRAGNGKGYCVQINWAYSSDTRALVREMTFLRDDDEGRHRIPASEFLSATELTCATLDAWANHVIDDLIVGGYLKANAQSSRFSEDVGGTSATDDTDWGMAT